MITSVTPPGLPLGVKVHFEYSNGELSKSTDLEGVESAYTYKSSNGKIEKITIDPDGANPKSYEFSGYGFFPDSYQTPENISASVGGTVETKIEEGTSLYNLSTDPADTPSGQGHTTKYWFSANRIWKVTHPDDSYYT